MGRDQEAYGNRGEAMSKIALITGSSGLLGSACVRHFAALGYEPHGVDNNARRDFFGESGDTTANRLAVEESTPGFVTHEIDIRDRDGIAKLFADLLPAVVIHCAGQPSHDLARSRPFDDFETNAIGTLNLLEATRWYASDAPFVFASTNKVYGDAPNNVQLKEYPTRWEITDPKLHSGFDETLPIDQSRHSLFGVSKAAADLMVQEYGRSFGLKTGCFRFGCITGAAHAGVELHGFLAYLAKCCREGIHYRVYGYKGKQVRDQIHAADAAAAFSEFCAGPRPGHVYNLGGGLENSVSVLEAIFLIEQATGRKLEWEYVDEPRGGDHIVYYSDTGKFRSHYPKWKITRPRKSIVRELADAAAELVG